MVAAGDALRTARQNRKLARQLQTSNSLKQIGLAMHNYLDMGPAGLAYGTNTRPVDYFLANNGVVNPTVRFAQSRPMVAHSASIVLVVSKIDEAESQLNDLLSQLDGTISHAEVTEPQGQPRTASWVVRVPSESLHDFLQKVANFGTPENRIVNSQDVGDEYVDLQARIATKRELEKRILKLLEEQTGDLPEVLKVEEQLARIREEIERMEGRIQHLDSVTAMSTVKVSAREEQNYVPPQAPTFSGEIDQTWQDSLELLEDLGKALVICVIAIVPWLPLLLIPVLVIRLWLKRRRATAEE